MSDENRMTADVVMAVVRDAVLGWLNCSGSCGDEEHEAEARHISARVAEKLAGRIADLESQLATLSAELDQAHQAGAALVGKLRVMSDIRGVLDQKAPRETSASIAAWADDTFGKPESNMSIWERAAQEFEELQFKLMADDNHPDAAEECADVCIVLDRLVHRLGKDMAQERDRKMSVNRARTWSTTGDGHGQHVEDGGDQ